MRNIEIRCDKCGAVVEKAGSSLLAESGFLRSRRRTAWDLCVACSSDFLTWLRPELGTLEPTDTPLRTIDPHLVEA